MMDQIDLERARYRFIPRQLQHRNALGQRMLGCPTGMPQAQLILGAPAQQPFDRGDAGLLQLRLQLGRHFQLSMGGQVPGCGGQTGGQALGAGVIQGLGDHVYGILNGGPIDRPALAAPWLPLQITVHQADQCLAIQAGHLFHLIQESSPFLVRGRKVAGLHHAEVLAALVNVHNFLGSHQLLR